MYYEEQVVDGVLCYRLSPEQEFMPMTKEQLTEIIMNLRRQVHSEK